MVQLNRDASLLHAKEFTLSAIEHNLIPSDSDAIKAAENVYLFYKTLYEKFSGNKEQ